MNQTPARAQQQNGALHPEVAKFVHGVSETYHGRDELISENTTLRNRAEVAEGMNDHLKAQLSDVTADRDYHMRLAIALTTRLNAAMDMLGGILSVSQHEAQNPGPKRLAEVAHMAEGTAHADPGR